jgi:hypothetical protein
LLPELARYARSVRASDEERERTVQALRDHFAVGRLESAELEHRVRQAYAARTRRELALLLIDLPSDRTGRAARRLYRGQRTVLKYHAVTYVTVNGSLVGIWELTGQGVFWPGLVMVPASVLLATHASTSRWLRKRLGVTRRR